MYYAGDLHHHLLFFRFQSIPPTEAEWAFYTAAFERVMKPGQKPPYAIAVEVEVAAAMPLAKWRHRFATGGSTGPHDGVFVLIVKSPLARAAVAAVNKLRPFSFRYGVVATREQAALFLGAHRSDLTEALPSLIRRSVRWPTTVRD